jgi:Tfp pilus assembly protein PilN
MIEINLLPGAARKAKGRGAGVSLGSLLGDVRLRARDPYLLAAIGSVLLASAAIGGTWVTQQSTADALAAREEQALADSSRFASVLRERRKAEATRDSVQRQLAVIRAIDAERFVWPRIMDEVSRALPPYTWLRSLSVMDPLQPAPQMPADSAKRKDPVPMPDPLRFRLVGNTVDIQALTRFMRLLEASPFIHKVHLAKSEMAMMEGKEVTEFQLEAEYERPEPTLLATAPVALSVR